jgi:uncharacterized repeat protein (TIGR02543 family)
MNTKNPVLTVLIITVLICLNLGLSSASASPTLAQTQNTILYVKPGEEGNCSSWETACDLQDALALAEAGDQVWVAAGTYKPTTGTDRTATFLLESGVAIYGGFAGTETSLTERDWETNLTTLSGDIGTEDDLADNSFHVVTGSGLSDTTILDGFTITAANANGGSSSQKVGGGMNILNSSPTLKNINFSGNLAHYGAGMQNQSGSPILTNVDFSGNIAIERGGGMYNLYSSNPALTNVTFSSNSAGSSGGGMYNYESSSPTLTNVTFFGNTASDGGGMLNLFTSSPTLTNVTFSSNTATHWGGGMYNSTNCNSTLTNVLFSGNSADSAGGMFNANYSSPTISHTTFSNNTAYNGGGMGNSQSHPTLTNVTFSGNTATNEGGGMSNYYFSGIMNNVTFFGNTAIDGGAMKSERSNPTVTNSIFWGNTPNQLIFVIHSYPIITYSIVQGDTVWDGIGNLNTDPLLGDLADNGGFTMTHALGDLSPAIDAGSPTLCPAMDQRGFYRPIDGDENTSEICDMGAYEYSSYPEEFTLTADTEGNGSVAIDPDQTEYQFGEIVSLTASADPGWSFSGWSGNASGTTNPLTISILDDTSITANFTQNEYTLDVLVDPVDSGSVSVDPQEATYHYGDTVTLTASPNTGWAFTGWSGDATGIENPLEVTITHNTNITANFSDEYSLVVTVDPANSGTVTVAPEQSIYQYGDEVTLTATAETGWTFSGWSGDAEGTENPLTVTIQANTSITANFTQIEYSLTVTVDPVDSGSVLVDPIKDFYHYGDQVTLTPTADPDWEFTNWSADADSTDNPLIITILGDTNLTANFEQVIFKIFLPLIVR